MYDDWNTGFQKRCPPKEDQHKKILRNQNKSNTYLFPYHVASKLGCHFPGLIPIQTWGQFHKRFGALHLSFAPSLNFYANKTFSKVRYEWLGAGQTPAILSFQIKNVKFHKKISKFLVLLRWYKGVSPYRGKNDTIQIFTRIVQCFSFTTCFYSTAIPNSTRAGTL